MRSGQFRFSFLIRSHDTSQETDEWSRHYTNSSVHHIPFCHTSIIGGGVRQLSTLLFLKRIWKKWLAPKWWKRCAASTYNFQATCLEQSWKFQKIQNPTNCSQYHCICMCFLNFNFKGFGLLSILVLIMSVVCRLNLLLI